MGYAPLDLLSKSEQPNREFEARKEQFVKLGLTELEDVTEEEFISFMLSENLMNSTYKGKFSHFNNVLWDNIPVLAATVGCSSVNEFIDRGLDARTEWKDLYLAPCLLDRWARNKQVYKPDADFAEALIHTDNLQIVKEQINYLPFKEFYVDLSDCKKFYPVVGVFVFVHDFVANGVEGVDVSFYLLTDKLVYFSFYGGGYYKNGVLDIPIKDMPAKEYEVFLPFMSECINDYTFSRKDATCFALQMLCYLSSKKPDIEENPVTKNTYRPSAVVKNKFSEVKKWDVGIRYGKSIRINTEKAMKIIEEERRGENAPTQKQNYLNKQRALPRPHYRCAHWQHYWTGPGRRVYEVRWIEPVFVGFGRKNDSQTDVVIHKVKN